MEARDIREIVEGDNYARFMPEELRLEVEKKTTNDRKPAPPRL
jgi:hypothetical protein